MCTDSSTNTNSIPPWNIFLNMDLPHRRRNTLLAVDPTAEHHTHHGQWTCPNMEHPNHCGPTPLWNTLFTLDLPPVEHPSHLTEDKNL